MRTSATATTRTLRFLGSRARLAGASLIFGALLLTACSGGGDDVVAVVNGDPIPLYELDNQLKSANADNFPSFAEELRLRKVIVDTLVIQQLLVQEAYKLNLNELEEVARIALSNKEKFLLDALFEREIATTEEVSEATLQSYYDRLEYKFRASHILVATQEEAQSMLDSLDDGAPFGRLAFNHSLDRTSAKENGDLGYFVWGQMVDPIQNAAIQMAPGETSSPIRTKFGWHIFRVTEKIPNSSRASFASMKFAIKQDILARKRNERLQAYFEKVAEKFPVTVEERTVDFLLKKRESLYPPLYLDRLPKNDFDLEQLDRDEKALTMATWDGGQISVGEYLTRIRSIPREAVPNFDQTDSLSQFIFRLKFNEILGLEARRLGLESSDEFKLKMKRFRELTMAEMMKDSIPQPPPPDDPELLRYYEEHLDEFTSPAKVHLFEVLVSDEGQARKLRKEIRTLSKLREAAAELTERGGKRATRGDLGLIERTWFKDIFDAAQDIPIGGMGGPIRTMKKWSIFYVADKIVEEVKSYDAVKRQINESLTAQRRQEAFARWVEEKMTGADVTVYDEAIENSIDADKYPATTDVQQDSLASAN